MYKHIMVPLDGSKLAECVLPHLQSITKSCESGKVTFIRIVVPLHLHEGLEDRIPVEERRKIEGDSVKVAKEYLENVIKKTNLPNITAKSAVSQGQVNEKLLEFAEGNAVDLIMFSTHGRSGINRWVWGSTADKLLRSVCVPVIMVRAPGCGLISNS
jgi:nucleotide-binding universal stress UspA family protein